MADQAMIPLICCSFLRLDRQISSSPAGLGKKGLNRTRHNTLLFLIGFVNEKGERIGETEYMSRKFRRHRRMLSKAATWLFHVIWHWVLLQIGNVGNGWGFRSSGCLRWAQNLEWPVFEVVFLAMMILILMVVDSGEFEPEEDPEHRRRRYMVSTLSETSDPDYWMVANHHDDMSRSSKRSWSWCSWSPRGNSIAVWNASCVPFHATEFSASTAFDDDRSFNAGPWICNSLLSIESSSKLWEEWNYSQRGGAHGHPA